jgi:hypothetical protein
VVKKTYRASDVYPVCLQWPSAIGLDHCVYAQNAAAYLRLAKPDRWFLGRAGTGWVIPIYPWVWEVQVTPHPYAICKQAGQSTAPGESEFMQMGTLECWGRVEYAPVKPQWEWHFNPRQIQAPCDRGPAQAHPTEINLALQLKTAATQKGGIQPSADTISRAIKSPPFAKRAKKLGFAYCAHLLTPVSPSSVP